METNKVKSKLNYPIVVLSIVTGVVVASLYVYVAVPLYNSTSKIVSPVEANSSSTVTLFDSPESVSTEEIKTLSFLTNALENNPGLISTFTTCDYRTTPAGYSFPYEIKYKSIGNKSFQPQAYNIKETGSNTFSLTGTSYGIERTKSGKFGEELIDNNLAITITKKEKHSYIAEGLFTSPTFQFKIQSGYAAANEMLLSNSKLNVADQNGIIKINVQWEHPNSAANFANAIAESYINSKTGTGNTNTTQFKTIESVSAQITSTENEISKYKQEHQISDIHAETEKNLTLLNELKFQKTQYEVQLAALNNMSTYLRKNREINNSQVEYGLINDPAFSENLNKLNQLYENKTNGNGEIVNEKEIEGLKTLIAERILNTRKKTAVQIDKINEAIASAQKSISKLPEQANTLQTLERKMQLDKKVYDMLIEQKAATIVNGVASGVNSNMITTATESTTPIWPSLSWMLTLGAIIGATVGVALSRILYYLKKNKVQNRSVIAEVTALPFIATIGDPNSQINYKINSANTLCTAVLMKSDVQLITITSSTSSEGKTFVTSQLAQALAAIDKKVLLIDMNLQHASLASNYKITPDNSLADVLIGTCDIHDAICLTSYPNLEILIAGELHAGINSFLSSSIKDEVISNLKKHYDYILIDTPPTGTSIDSVAMMKLSDLNLYIVRANTTRKNSLITAERMKKDYQINDIHLVLNNFNTAAKAPVKSRKAGRSINIQRNTQAKPTLLPGVLKKIALWFY